MFITHNIHKLKVWGECIGGECILYYIYHVHTTSTRATSRGFVKEMKRRGGWQCLLATDKACQSHILNSPIEFAACMNFKGGEEFVIYLDAGNGRSKIKGSPVHIWRDDVWHLLCRHNHQEWGHESIYSKLRTYPELVVTFWFLIISLEEFIIVKVFLADLHMLQPQEHIKIEGLEPLVWVLHLPLAHAEFVVMSPFVKLKRRWAN